MNSKIGNSWVAGSVFVFNEFNQVLLLKRSETDMWQPGKWCLPGGKIEAGETIIEGAIRETLEETGLSIVEYNLDYVGSIKKNRVHFFYTTEFTGKISLSFEHDDYKWNNLAKINADEMVPGFMEMLNKTLEVMGNAERY